jgi:subtilisin family serine protease
MMGFVRFFVFPSRGKIGRSVHAMASARAGKDAQEVCWDCGLDPALLEKHKARIRHTHRRVNCAVVEAPTASAGALRRALHKQGLSTQPVKPVRLLLHESMGLMEIPKVWNAGLSGKGVFVGIVDSGLDRSHPDFQGRIAGYKDFTESDLKDRVGHGTHVAGIIAGAGTLYRGAAPGAKIFAAKVFDQGGTTDDIVLAGMSWASYSGAQVLNLSLGGPGDPDDVLCRECDALMKEGIAVCVAAGNSGPRAKTIESPGASRLAITVGAADKFSKLAFYSSRGPVRDPKTRKDFIKPDLIACGGGYADIRGCDYKAGIVSARSAASPRGECSVANGSKYLYEKMSGTSMAAPHAAGICALLLLHGPSPPLAGPRPAFRLLGSAPDKRRAPSRPKRTAALRS